MGILSPIVITLKIMFQIMYKKGNSWDDTINNECQTLCKR